MQDAWRAYLELAMGVTEASRRKAEQVVRDLVGKTGGTAAQLQSVVEELVSTSRVNREGLSRLVRYELERTLGRMGLATADEVAELAERVRQVERQVQEATARAVAAEQAADAATSAASKPAPPVKKATRAPAKKSSTKAAAKKASTTKVAPRKASTNRVSEDEQ